MAIIGILIALLIALGVLVDASHRYEEALMPILWFVAVWMLLIVFLPIYLIVRPARLE